MEIVSGGEGLPMSRMLTGEYGLKGVCLSIPSLIGISSLKADAELDGLRHSADILRESIKGISI